MADTPTTAAGRPTGTPPLLAVDDLWVGYRSRRGLVPAVRQVGFTLDEGESLGLVGESGCGKSTLAYAVMHYLGRSGVRLRGSVRLRGRELADLPPEALRRLRGREAAMVYQDPTASLNPVLTVGEQLMEVPRIHEGADTRTARERALAMLAEVKLADPAALLQRYPHQLSGGQQQRVVIAMALMGRPRLLVMDEPTTGLDVTIEAAILDLVAELQARHGMALLFISHNLGTVMRVCGRLGVMYGGELVEEGPAEAVFRRPAHPYTQGLLDCLPTLSGDKRGLTLRPIPGQVPAVPQDVAGCVFAPRCPHAETPRCTSGRVPAQPAPAAAPCATGHVVRCVRAAELPPWTRRRAAAGASAPDVATEPLVRVQGLRKVYESGGWLGGGAHRVEALAGIDLEAPRGRTLAIVGESGCGKSTLARVLAGLETATEGSVRFEAVETAAVPVGERPEAVQRAVQMVFQHPDGTLNPSHTVGFAIARTLRRLANGNGGTAEGRKGRRGAVARLLERVHLPAALARRLPGQLSGGQKQRVAIARALAGNPALVVADEPVSALDVSVQAAILNLLLELQAGSGTTLLFISHDLAVVRFLADHVAVMYLGRIMETGPVDAVYAPPWHPYTEALLSAVPVADPDAARTPILLEGALPLPDEGLRGCAFHTRCPRKLGAVCETEAPPVHEATPGHRIACHIGPEELSTLQRERPVSARDRDAASSAEAP